MTIWRVLTLLGVGLTMLQTALDLADRGGGVETAGEVALLAHVFGGPSPAPAAGKTPDPADLLSALTH